MSIRVACGESHYLEGSADLEPYFLLMYINMSPPPSSKYYPDVALLLFLLC